MLPLLLPIGLGLIGGYLTKDSEHQIFAKGGIAKLCQLELKFKH
jgi:hypothetical protein